MRRLTRTAQAVLVAVLMTATVVSSTPAVHAQIGPIPVTGFAVLGDSNSDEYRADNNRGGSYAATSLNWVEQLVLRGRLNVGPWGTWGGTRRSGYEYNWARSGATASSMISGGQHSGAASQVAAGEVSHVFIHIGGNDFHPLNGSYRSIYDGTLSETQVTAKVDAFVADVTTAVDTITGAGAVEVVVANVADPGVFAPLAQLYPDPVGRQRGADAIGVLNAALDTMAAARSGVEIADIGPVLQIPIDGNGFTLLAGELVDVFNLGDEPHHFQLADNHAGTIASGAVIANALVLDALEDGFGVAIPRLTDQEILENAGILSPPAPAIAELTATPSTISAGGTATLAWDVQSALRVSLDDGIGYVPSSGSMELSPTVDTTYTLTATGPGGSTTAEVEIVVAGTPNPPSSVMLLDDWVVDGSYTTQDAAFDVSPGTDRVVVVMLSAEKNRNGPMSVGSVLLGDQQLTELVDFTVGSSGAYHNLHWVGYLAESGIAARNGSDLTVTYTNTPSSPFDAPKIHFASYHHVDQQDPIGDVATASSQNASTLQLGQNVTADEGDRILGFVVAGQHYGPGMGVGYSEQTESIGATNGHASASFHRVATSSVVDAPIFTSTSSTRMAVSAVVLNRAADPAADVAAPNPDPMGWVGAPVALGPSSVSLTATTATDTSGVEYLFTNTAGGGNSSGWQDSPTYIDTGLDPATTYTYTVTARDKSPNQNQTATSPPTSVTTDPAADVAAPNPDPMGWVGAPVALGPSSVSLTATTATDTSGVEYLFTNTAGGGNSSGWQDSPTYIDTGLDPATTYTYTVTARDKSPNQNQTATSPPTSVTTDPAPSSTNVELLDDWRVDGTYATQDATFDVSEGSDRVVLVMISAEKNRSGPMSVGAVHLGDQQLTELVDVTVGRSSRFHNLLWIGYLAEAEIAGRLGSDLTVTYTNAPSNPYDSPKIHFASYQHVDQATPIGDFATRSSTRTSSLQLGQSLQADAGDQIVGFAVLGQHYAPGMSTPGYDEVTESIGATNGHASAVYERTLLTAVSENPTFTSAVRTRVAVAALVLRSAQT